MKRIVNVQEVDGDGLEGLLGERVTFWCANYIYVGDLVGLNATCVRLDNAAVVYETGPLTDTKWGDAQPLPGTWYVQLAAVESFGVMGKS